LRRSAGALIFKAESREERGLMSTPVKLEIFSDYV